MKKTAWRANLLVGMVLVYTTCVAQAAPLSAELRLPSAGPLPYPASLTADNPAPPTQSVRLIFVHHSTGGNWLADANSDQPYGGLGRALMENNYFVSATNYGWGPEAIGDRTDIPNWPEWFTGPQQSTILTALYNEQEQNFGDFGAWPRLPTAPGGENEIIMFKSCFPNSDLYGHPDDPPLTAPNDQYTVENAKAVYIQLLTYFVTRPDKLFVIITAPPLQKSDTTPDRAKNARALNDWLVHDWLTDYPYPNVAVFDYYNVLTGPDHHHRWNGSEIEHLQVTANNYAAYPSGDSHPSTVGHQKATAEFVPLLNVFYNRWKSASPAQPVAPPATQIAPTWSPEAAPTLPARPTPKAHPILSGNVIDDFEADAELHTEGDNAVTALNLDNATVHGGQAALRIDYDIAAGGWSTMGRSFDVPLDGSHSTGLTLWLFAGQGNTVLTLMVFSGEPDAATPFETHLTIAPAEANRWQPFVFAWTDFAKADWAGTEGLSQLDPARITGYGLSLGDANGQRNVGTLWVDDIGFAAEQPQPAATPKADPTIAPSPTAPSQPATVTPPPPTTVSAPSAGACPAAAFMLVMPLAVFFNRRKKAPLQ